MRVVELKALAREHGLRGYSWLRKGDLIASVRESAPDVRARQPREQPIPALTMRPSIRFRLDRPGQPELMRRLEGIPPRPASMPAPRPAPN